MKCCGTDEFLKLAEKHPIFDARTPAEFDDGHLPGARNLPLFDDEERAEVGTLYKQKGRQEAILRGLDFVGPKMRALVEQVEEVCEAPGPVLVHCWRGGMRSSSLAWLLELYGYDITVLEGGYKAYRHHALETFETEFDEILVLGGLTGCGKTEVLDELVELGEQVIDLEGLANHRGSAFGGIERENVTQQQFDNELARVISELDPSRRVWVEDESRLVGTCFIPDGLWEQKRRAPLVALEISFDTRLDRLVAEYGEHPTEELAESFRRIQKRLGGRRLTLSLEALDDGDLRTAGHEALKYYDKAYSHGMENRLGPVAARLELEPRPSSAEIARMCIDTAESEKVRKLES